ncbi:MAG: 4-hydroxy-tetrahydrodipicolinate synthase [Candidatus Omnitrophica bacterium]|nr:4-hydroxy-tetrahydrodipicolinate synthase [Candidatus Omnitrophota bacterium]
MLRGSMVALVTPMKSGKVDYGALERLYQIQAAAKTDGVVICGTTGESATMTHGEHQDVIEHASEFFSTGLGPDAPHLIVGTGSNSTHEAVALTEYAAEKAVSGVLVISPYYNKPTPKGQIIHFREIAAAAGEIPVILYNVPGRTGLNMTVETTLELAEVSNIVGTKEASGDLCQVSEVIRRAPKGFSVVSGEDNLTFPMMALGATGVISVTANIVPEKVRDMVHLCLDGDFVGGRKIHQDLFSLTETLFCETNPIPVKTAVNLMTGSAAPGGGVWPDAGEFRLPMCPMTNAGLDRLKNALRAMNIEIESGVHV